MKEQDESLDVLMSSVQRVKEISREITMELDQDFDLLDDLLMELESSEAKPLPVSKSFLPFEKKEEAARSISLNKETPKYSSITNYDIDSLLLDLETSIDSATEISACMSAPVRQPIMAKKLLRDSEQTEFYVTPWCVNVATEVEASHCWGLGESQIEVKTREALISELYVPVNAKKQIRMETGRKLKVTLEADNLKFSSK